MDSFAHVSPETLTQLYFVINSHLVIVLGYYCLLKRVKGWFFRRCDDHAFEQPPFGSFVQDGSKKPLIPDPNLDRNPTNGSDRNADSLPSSCTDEQTLHKDILQRTALDIIDVSAVISQGLEQHEYMDRARQYSTKLGVLNRTLSQKKPVPLPSLSSHPQQVLAADLVSYADIQQVSKIAAYAYSAISQIKVDAKEELVVQFAIP
uniref:Ragulator complex protein LAMTOR1 n=1 Tax=Cyprinus carpio TaxID=7962 RepID=A0A8C2E3Z9_CYPCA